MTARILLIEDNQQSRYLAAVPIIAVTFYAMTCDREKALAAGCTSYIAKPINPETFVAEVGRHFPAAGKAGES